MLWNYIMFPWLSTIQKNKKYEKFRGPFEHEAPVRPLLNPPLLQRRLKNILFKHCARIQRFKEHDKEGGSRRWKMHVTIIDAGIREAFLRRLSYLLCKATFNFLAEGESNGGEVPRWRIWISSWDYQTKRGETARLCELSRSETFHGARREGNSIELRNEFEFASGLWIAEEF